ncbi:MAG: hypothetical protein H7249_11305 [Chitinophagaceae bacterium]|nr:hypothetical protein [Oligoflexus sp.]
MKLLTSAIAGLALYFSPAVFGAPAAKVFTCPASDVMPQTWNPLLGQMKPINSNITLENAQKEAFLQTVTNGLPNMNVLSTRFEQDGTSYDLVGVKDTFVFLDYPDANAAVFESGQTKVVGIISSDTDRGLLRCKAIVDNKTAYLTLSATDFDELISSANAGNVVYQGEHYINFVSVTKDRAQGTDQLGLAVIFIRAA